MMGRGAGRIAWPAAWNSAISLPGFFSTMNLRIAGRMKARLRPWAASSVKLSLIIGVIKPKR
jgi:hypothetical protein